jgi:hypothetical protein
VRRCPTVSVPLAFVVLAAALALVAGACSGSISVGSSPSPTGPVTYTNGAYGYSITHDARLVEGTSKGGAAAGSTSVSDVIFVDTHGAVAQDTYLDALKVSVYELARSVKPADVPGLRKELQGTLDEVLASLTDAKVVQPLAPTVVNGVPGFAIRYTYDDLGKHLTMTSVFLFKGAHEFQIATQATSDHWEALKGAFADAVKSFTVK